MVKADLARIVYEKHGGITQREALEIVDLIIDKIKGRLLAGENVKLARFGSLNLIDRRARMGRNPQTGERIELGPSRYVSFRPSPLLQTNEVPAKRTP